jgi:hypothetical protein
LAVTRWSHAAIAGALLTGLAAGRAQAYVRSTTDGSPPEPFHWNETCVPITIYLNGFTKTPAASGMTDTDVIKSVSAAAHTWSTDAVTCPGATSPSLEIVPSVAADAATPPKVAWDAKNSIIFRTDMWTKSGVATSEIGGTASGETADSTPYDPSALAVTTVTARGDGHIVDADMEINAVSQTWMNFDPGIYASGDHGLGSDVYDLQNALTHEFGHFIGLAHTCYTPSTTDPSSIHPVDNNGKLVPDCPDPGEMDIQTDAATAAAMSSVMWPVVTDPSSTSNRTLYTDDINAVCSIYPQGRTAPACALDQMTPGCAVASPRASRRWGLGRAVSLAVVGLLVVAVGARRRRVSGQARARA